MRAFILPSLLCASLIASLGGCTLAPKDFAGTEPAFDIQQFYSGHSRSQGVIESRTGQPLKRVSTETWGRMKDGQLELTQDISLGDAKPTRRVWQIKRMNAHHYEASTKSVVGVARGESQGNAFRFSYILALQPGNPFSNVRMTHWMYLQPGRETMLNRVRVYKAGLLVAQISEVFRRDPSKAVRPAMR